MEKFNELTNNTTEPKSTILQNYKNWISNPTKPKQNYALLVFCYSPISDDLASSRRLAYIKMSNIKSQDLEYVNPLDNKLWSAVISGQ